MPGLIRVLVVDEHAIVRAGVRTMLASAHDMIVVGEASNAKDALAQAAPMAADVVVMELSPDHHDALAFTRSITDSPGAPRVLVLTLHASRDLLLAALEAGASGYLLKSAAEPELPDAIRALASGRMYVQPSAARVLADRVRPRDAGREQRRLLATLCDRDREVLRLFAEGNTGSAIGERLAISARTVETCKHRIGETLGISGRPAFVRFALQAGLLLARPGEHRVGIGHPAAPAMTLPAEQS